ncbi:HBR081Cp [Eremothecium sinecaudum]|uniref:Peroxin-7 n=1 Tax=Eremothecium sinecaudum TaxID=45286 RepID=A0A109UXJ5_9SACH|nr:HBR081Cp [Eremothecium sinecaudum]AMD18982.1 HBR081Cp [Eremothecium sinecaudum]
MLSYHMNGYSGYGIQYSPFFDDTLAVATGSNFGLVGNGKLFILRIAANGQIAESNSFLTIDGLFDVAWNELNENQVLTAQGDGSLRLFDVNLQKYPVAIFKEHQREVFSCSWNLLHKQTFLSSSWDGTVKVWSPSRQQSLNTLIPYSTNSTHICDQNVLKNEIPMSKQLMQQNRSTSNRDCIYQALYSPHDPNIVISCSGNSYVSIFDIRQPAQTSQQQFIAHKGLEALSCDFNKYRPYVIATGGVDKMVKTWDLRMIRQSLLNSRSSPVTTNEMQGHSLAVRKVAWSPHHSNKLLSTSYDMTCRVWHDLSDGPNGQYSGKTNNSDPQRGCRMIFSKHTEFVFGADWSLWGEPGYVATAGWDGHVYAWYALAGQ